MDDNYVIYPEDYGEPGSVPVIQFTEIPGELMYDAILKHNKGEIRLAWACPDPKACSEHGSNAEGIFGVPIELVFQPNGSINVLVAGKVEVEAVVEGGLEFRNQYLDGKFYAQAKDIVSSDPKYYHNRAVDYTFSDEMTDKYQAAVQAGINYVIDNPNFDINRFRRTVDNLARKNNISNDRAQIFAEELIIETSVDLELDRLVVESVQREVKMIMQDLREQYIDDNIGLFNYDALASN